MNLKEASKKNKNKNKRKRIIMKREKKKEKKAIQEKKRKNLEKRLLKEKRKIPINLRSGNGIRMYRLLRNVSNLKEIALRS